MTYTPPAGFKAEDVGKLKSQEIDQKAVACNDVVYSAAPPNSGEGYQGLSMGVTIIHPAMSCAPQGMVADDFMKAMVAGGAKMPGLTPFKEFATYSVDGRNFAAVIGKGAGATAGQRFTLPWLGPWRRRRRRTRCCCGRWWLRTWTCCRSCFVHGAVYGEEAARTLQGEVEVGSRDRGRRNQHFRGLNPFSNFADMK